jgi:hypothetical protein
MMIVLPLPYKQLQTEANTGKSAMAKQVSLPATQGHALDFRPGRAVQ